MSVIDLKRIDRALAKLSELLQPAKRQALAKAVRPLLAAYRRSGYQDSAVLTKILRLLERYQALVGRQPSETKPSRGATTKRRRRPAAAKGGGAGRGRRTTEGPPPAPIKRRVRGGGKLYTVRRKAGGANDVATYKRGKHEDRRKDLRPGRDALAQRAADSLSTDRRTATKSKAKAKTSTGRKPVHAPKAPPRESSPRGEGTGAAPGRATDTANRTRRVAVDHLRSRRAKPVAREEQPRWILAKVFDCSAAGPERPTLAFRAGAMHELRVIIGAAQPDWLVARGRDASESIDRKLPKGTHELTVVFFIPALGIHQTDTLILPPSGPTPAPAKFRFQVGAAGTPIEALISIVHRGRVLQTALLSGTAVANPRRAPKKAQISLRLQVVVPSFRDLDRREAFDAALVTATGAAETAVAAGVVHTGSGAGKTVYFAQPRINEAARSIRDVLEEVVTDDRVKRRLDSEAAEALLWKLAQQGRILYEQIGERLEQELAGQDLSRLQLVQADPGAFIPIEFTYALPPPANGARLCKNWKGALTKTPCTAAHHKTNALGHLEVVCPSGFWGVSKVIERQILRDRSAEQVKTSDFGVRAEPSSARPSLPPIQSALFAWSEILDNTVPGTSADVLKSLNRATQQHAAAVKTWLQWADKISKQDPGLLVLLSHTVEGALEIGPENSGERATVAQINSRYVKKLTQDAPIVFLLGCTTGVADDTLVSFVGRFRDQGAAIVIGTITPVLGERSAAVIKAVVGKLAQKRKQPARFGELMRDARRDLLRKGELTALCAASFGDASWFIP